MFVGLFVGGWICLYSYGLCVKNNKKSLTCTLQINGYYTSGIDGVFFTFEGCNFDRKYTVDKFVAQYGDDFPQKCDIHLRLSNILPKMYYIDILFISEK